MIAASQRPGSAVHVGDGEGIAAGSNAVCSSTTMTGIGPASVDSLTCGSTKAIPWILSAIPTWDMHGQSMAVVWLGCWTTLHESMMSEFSSGGGGLEDDDGEGGGLESEGGGPDDDDGGLEDDDGEGGGLEDDDGVARQAGLHRGLESDRGDMNGVGFPTRQSQLCGNCSYGLWDRPFFLRAYSELGSDSCMCHLLASLPSFASLPRVSKVQQCAWSEN